METKFCEIEIGVQFTFCGLNFIKTAADKALDNELIEHAFMRETVVEVYEAERSQIPLQLERG